MRRVMAIVWLVTVSYVSLGASKDLLLPVDVDVESSAEIMCYGINHDVEYDGCEDPISAN
jgi:hypothetical protein